MRNVVNFTREQIVNALLASPKGQEALKNHQQRIVVEIVAGQTPENRMSLTIDDAHPEPAEQIPEKVLSI